VRFGSLFAGIGGVDLGLERAGMGCAWQVEIDDFCQKVLTKHWPDVPKYRDIRDVGKENLETVDLVCGGFPCQPVSVAGQRKGDKDERWLWDEFYRVISEIKPTWILVENVPGLLSAGDGRLFGGILRDLAAGGYDAEWESISAASVGAPHIRERVFIFANNKGLRCRGVNGGVDDGPPKGKIDSSYNSIGFEGKGLSSWWENKPNVGRVVYGVPVKLDRLKSLGNAVVPQVAEFIGRMILEASAVNHLTGAANNG